MNARKSKILQYAILLLIPALLFTGCTQLTTNPTQSTPTPTIVLPQTDFDPTLQAFQQTIQIVDCNDQSWKGGPTPIIQKYQKICDAANAFSQAAQNGLIDKTKPLCQSYYEYLTQNQQIPTMDTENQRLLCDAEMVWFAEGIRGRNTPPIQLQQYHPDLCDETTEIDPNDKIGCQKYIQIHQAIQTAVKNQNPTLCPQISSDYGLSYDVCIMDIAAVTQNTSLCTHTPFMIQPIQDARDTCIQQIAIAKNDTTLCNQIQKQTIAQRCLQEINTIQKQTN